METIKLTQEAGIATISFNRPQAMNTYNAVMAEEFAKAVTQVAEDASTRAVVLTGEGGVFMAGGDILFFQENLNQLATDLPQLFDHVHQTVTCLTQMDKPILAIVEGAVAGIGLGFMLAADVVVAASNTQFNTAYCGLGISPDGGTSYGLLRHLGPKKAMQLLFSAERFTAEQAQAYGLVNWVVDAEKLEAFSQSLIQRLAQGPTQAFAACKALINSPSNSLDEQLNREAEYFTLLAQSNDFKQGVQAFLSKRKPQFSGQ